MPGDYYKVILAKTIISFGNHNCKVLLYSALSMVNDFF